jgi:hypothetical protein
MSMEGTIKSTWLTSIEFLRGAATTDECKPIFEQYEKCLSVSLFIQYSSIVLTKSVESPE